MKSNAGFTLIEVLVATVLFVIAIGSIISARNRALRVVTESGLLAQAQTLAEMKMTDMELKYQEAIDKAGVKSAFGKDEGSFDAPYETFKWSVEIKENPLVISQEQLLGFLKAFGMSEEDSQSQYQQAQLLLANLNKALKENMAELALKVTWKFAGRDKDLVLVTHLIPKKPKIAFTQNTDVDKDYSP